MYSGTPNQSLTSRGIQLSFLTTADLLSYEKTFMDQGAVANGNKLPAAKIYDLFRMSNIDNESLVKIWDLSSVSNAPFLTLPEFVLAMFLINLKLNGKPLPHSLPSSIRQEIQMAMTTLSSQPMQASNQFNPQQQQQQLMPQQQLMSQQQLPMMTGMPPPQMPLMTGAPVPAVQTSYTTGYQVPMQTGFNTPTPPPQVQNFDFAMKMMPNQSRASNLLGTAAGANRNSWKISPEDKQRYREVFYAWETTGTGYISGEVAKEVFTQSQIPPNDLQKIWNLADADNKGSLDIDEFAIAMHLIYRKSNGLDVPSELPTELAPPTSALKKFVLGHRPPASAPRFNSSSETNSRQKNQSSRHYVNDSDSDSDSDVDMEAVEALRRQISEAKRYLSQVQSEAPRGYGADAKSIGIKYSLEELKEKIKRANQDLTAAYRNNMSSSKYIENTSTLFELLETQKSLQDEIQYLCNRDIPVLTRQLRGSAAELRDSKLRNSKKSDGNLDFMSFIKPTGLGGTVTESDRVRAKAQAMMAARRAGSGSGSNSNSEARRAKEEKEEADRKADYAERDIERSRTALSDMRGDLRYLEEMGISNHFDDKKRFDNVQELSYDLRRFIEQLNHESAMNFSYSSQNYGSRNTSSAAPSTTATTASGSSTVYKNSTSTSANAPVSSPNPASTPSRPRTAEEIKQEAERRVQERLAALQAKRNPGGVPKTTKPSSVSKPDEAAAQKVHDDERQAQERLRASVAQRQEERERKNNTFGSSREIEPVYNTVEQSNVQNEEDEAERLRREQEEDEQRRIDEEKELEERRRLVLAKEEAARQARFDALKREEEEAELRAQKYMQHKPEDPVIEQKEAPVAPVAPVTEPSSTGAAVPPPPPPPPPPAPATPVESTSTPSTGSKNPFAKLQQGKSTTETTRSIPSSSQPEKPNESANKRTSYNPFAAFSAFSATKGGSKDDSDSEDDGWDAHNDSEDEDEFPAAGSAKNLAGMIFNVMNKKQGGSSLETVPESSPTLSSSDIPEPTSSGNVPLPPPPPPPAPAALAAPAAPAAPAVPQQSFTQPDPSGDSRSALLGQIQMGTSLRKVTINDRSASSVAGKVLDSTSTPSQPIQTAPIISNTVSQESQPEPISTPTPSDGFFSELQARTNGNTSVEPQVQSSEESGTEKEYIALWDYPGSGPDDLSFSQDDVVLVRDDKDSEDWWFGILKDSKKSGYFPRNYVEPKPSDIPALNLKARALYDFDAPEGQDCLSVTTGNILTVIKKDNNDWWRVQSEDGSKTGLVPANYVELV